MTRKLRNALVVAEADSDTLRIIDALSARRMRVVTHGTVRSAKPHLARRFDLLWVDAHLPDGNGVALVKAATQLAPAPLIVAMGRQVASSDVFELAQSGALAFVERPLTDDDVEAVMEHLQTTFPRLDPWVAAQVGTRDLRDIQDDVRRAAVRQAVALSRGNRARAGRLLNVTRQAVQHMMRTLNERAR